MIWPGITPASLCMLSSLPGARRLPIGLARASVSTIGTPGGRRCWPDATGIGRRSTRPAGAICCLMPRPRASTRSAGSMPGRGSPGRPDRFSRRDGSGRRNAPTTGPAPGRPPRDPPPPRRPAGRPAPLTERVMPKGPFDLDVCVVGGCGHVGLPLAITFARSGLKVGVYDINERAVETVRSGRMPFLETGAEEVLREVVDRNAGGRHRPGPGLAVRARGGRHRHAGRRAPQPDLPHDAAVVPGAAAPSARRPDGRSCAARSSPARPRRSAS